MSQHNIVGSEAFDRSPFVIIRAVKTGGMRRRRARTAIAFIAGAGFALAAGVTAVVVVFAPALSGG